MDVLDAIRTRRTDKRFQPEPVPRAQLKQLLELARWAPVHRMTEPWRFRVVGPAALARLKAAAGEGAKKLERAPTLIVASYVPSPLPLHAAEDHAAAACAIYALLLAAHADGLASYWRTPGVLRTPEGRTAVHIPDSEHVLGLIHLGEPTGDSPEAPSRRELSTYTEFLD